MKNGLIRNVVMLGLIGVIGFTMQGCSIGRALSGPSPVAVDRVKIGESRNTIISVLGIPKASEPKPDGKTDMYEFTDGYSNVSKARVILYIAGDFFTLGLSELVFWPIELAAGDGIKGRAIVTYGMDDIARSVMLTKVDGTPWEYAAPDVAPPGTTSSRIDPGNGSLIQN